MTFQSIPETCEMVLVGNTAASEIRNVLHFRKTGGYDQTALDDLAQVGDAAVGTDYLPFCGSGVNYGNTITRGLQDIVDLTGANNDSAGTGTMSGAFTLPSNCSFCMTLRSGHTGRSARGRFYAWPAEDTALAAVDTVTTTYRNGIRTFLNNLKTAAAGIGWTMVIASRRTANAPRLVGVTFIVTDIDSRNLTMDSQRGRLPSNH